MSHLVGRDPATGRVLRVEIDGGLISGVSQIGGQAEHWIAPGLIDLQVNGYNGFDVNEQDLRQETVAGLVRALARVGVTSVVPTLITAPADQLLASLATIARARNSAGDIAHAIPYIHVEGPFLSDQDGPRGVHDARHIRPPDVAEVSGWQRASHGLVGMVTISPHWPCSASFIRAVTGLGIRVAIGHTHATSEQVSATARTRRCRGTPITYGPNSPMTIFASGSSPTAIICPPTPSRRWCAPWGWTARTWCRTLPRWRAWRRAATGHRSATSSTCRPTAG